MSGQYFPYVLGYKHATMAGTKGSQAREGEQIPSKPVLSSDSRLKLACLKSESLVTVGQHTTVNTFPGLVHTARQTNESPNPAATASGSRLRWGDDWG